MWEQIITYGYNYIILHTSLDFGFVCFLFLVCDGRNDAWQITLDKDLKRNPLSLYVTLNPKCCHT